MENVWSEHDTELDMHLPCLIHKRVTFRGGVKKAVHQVKAIRVAINDNLEQSFPIDSTPVTLGPLQRMRNACPDPLDIRGRDVLYAVVAPLLAGPYINQRRCECGIVERDDSSQVKDDARVPRISIVP